MLAEILSGHWLLHPCGGLLGVATTAGGRSVLSRLPKLWLYLPWKIYLLGDVVAHYISILHILLAQTHRVRRSLRCGRIRTRSDSRWLVVIIGEVAVIFFAFQAR